MHPDPPGSWGAAQGTASRAAPRSKTAARCAAASPAAAAAAAPAAAAEAAAAEVAAVEAAAAEAAAAGLPAADLAAGTAAAGVAAAGAAAAGAAADPAAAAPLAAAALCAASPRLSATRSEDLPSSRPRRRSQGKPPWLQVESPRLQDLPRQCPASRVICGRGLFSSAGHGVSRPLEQEPCAGEELKRGAIQRDPRSSKGDPTWLDFHEVQRLVTIRHPLLHGVWGTDLFSSAFCCF